jgi:hypothetical protein
MKNFKLILKDLQIKNFIVEKKISPKKELILIYKILNSIYNNMTKKKIINELTIVRNTELEITVNSGRLKTNINLKSINPRFENEKNEENKASEDLFNESFIIPSNKTLEIEVNLETNIINITENSDYLKNLEK